MLDTLTKPKGFGGNALSEGHRPPQRSWRRSIAPPDALPEIPVTLICVDTTDRVDLSSRAIRECLAQAKFSEVKLLTHDTRYPHAVQIPRIDGIPNYSRFMIRDLHKYVQTSHCLVVQWDGYICDATKWDPNFLRYDYIGAPWYQWNGLVGNGGFSLRSKKLLQVLAQNNWPEEHPEDSYICMRYRKPLEDQGIQFAPTDLASQFAIESRTYDGTSWQGSPKVWRNHFGFHSYLTPLPDNMDRPPVFHHSGDYGDIIYALPVIKALGGGMLFLSPDNQHPFPSKARGSIDPDWVGNIVPLLHKQPYIWQCLHTGAMPFSVDYDLNAFRDFYRKVGPDMFANIISLHLRRFQVSHDEQKPWLTVDEPKEIPGRPIVVNRTLRYHDDKFPWFDLIENYRNKMVFIGSNEEYEYFKGFSPHKLVPHHPTPNLLDVARVIAGAKVFIGNQSCPMAIAFGLGKNIIQEVWPLNSNCRLRRDNAIYWQSGGLSIPEEWLNP